MGIRSGFLKFPYFEGPQEQSCPKGPKLPCSATADIEEIEGLYRWRYIEMYFIWRQIVNGINSLPLGSLVYKKQEIVKSENWRLGLKSKKNQTSFTPR